MNISPYYNTSSTTSSEESQSPETRVEENPNIPKIYNTAVETIEFIIDFKKRMSQEQAKQHLNQLAGGKAFWALNPLNLLHVDVMRTIQELMKNGEVRRKVSQDLLDEISTKFHYIFRAFRQYSGIINGQTSDKKKKLELLKAMQLWSEVSDLCDKLKKTIERENVPGAKNALIKLKEHCGIIFHLSIDANFIDLYSQALTTERDIKTHLKKHPPIHGQMSLYLETLGYCNNSLTLYHNHLEKKIKTPLQQKIEDLSKKNSPHLKSLITLLQIYQHKLNTTLNQLPQGIETLIKGSKENQSNSHVTQCLENLGKLDAFEGFLGHFPSIMKPWSPFQKNFNSMAKSFEAEANQILKEIEDEIASLRKKKKCPNLILTSIEKICSWDQLHGPYNAFVIEPYRLPNLIIQDIDNFSKILYPIHQAAKKFQNTLLQGKHPPCISFSALDLLFQQISSFSAEILSKNDPRENAKIQALIPELFIISSLLAGLLDDSLLKRQVGSDNFLLLAAAAEKLTFICDILLPMLSDKSELKASLISLAEYIQYIPDTPSHDFAILKQHCISTLLEPLNPRQETMTVYDIYWVRQHAALMMMLAKNNPTHELYLKLEQQILKRLGDCPVSGQNFWKNNLDGLRSFLPNIEKIKKNDLLCAEKLQHCTHSNEVLAVLQKWREKSVLSEDWGNQFNIMTSVAQLTPNLKEIADTSSKIVHYNNATHLINMVLNDIANRNPIFIQPKSRKGLVQAPQIKEIQAQIKEKQEEILPLFQEVHKPSSYYSNLEFLGSLHSSSPPPLTLGESCTSYEQRTLIQKDLIQNASLYLHLIEEAKKLPESLKTREKLDQLLLLELTEKIALASLNMGAEKDQQNHICNSFYHNRPLLSTHDGQALTKFLPAELFQNLEPLIAIQEDQLKKAYWFKEEPTAKDTTPILPACEKAWKSLAKTARIADSNQQKRLLPAKKQKIEVPVGKLTDSRIQELLEACTALAKSTKIDPQCREYVIGELEAIKRICASATAWNHSKGIQTPLNFAVRSEEIQANLLSSLMKILLCTVKVSSDQIHPLFRMENESTRPLAFSHHSNKLWKAAKNTLNCQNPDIDQYLSLFRGDLRYPYPWSTPLTDDIIAMHELASLHKKVQDREFFNEKDKDLFNQYLGNGGWQIPAEKQEALLYGKITEKMKEQMKKTALAFDLGQKILDLA